MKIEHKTEKGTLLFRMLPNDGNFFNTGITAKNPTPDGFEFIRLTSEVTEEQAKMMVPLIKRVYGQSYYDYTVKFKVGYGYFGTALQSFKSLMQHLKVYDINPFEKPISTLTHIHNDFTKNSNYLEFKNWECCESRTGKWIVLFKSND